jgi:VWFA-related protein
MRVQNVRRWIARILTLTPVVLATAIVSGQTSRTQQTPVFRSTTDLITTEVRVVDKTGKFVSDLRLDEFQLFEDGVPQKISAFVRSIGGRIMNDIAPSVGPVGEGLILPPQRASKDQSGRIFIIFIDDMHLQALDSPQVRNILGMIRDTIIHDNDLVGLVSTGYSSIEVDPTYDYQHRRFNEAIKKVMGSGMTPQEIITANQTAEGPAGIRHNTHVAFSTAYDLLDQLGKITNRRKAFIYVSNGYDFNPFKNARFKYEQDKYARPDKDNPSQDENAPPGGGANNESYENPFEKNGQQFAETDLIAQVAELTRAAKRANVTFYTVDPRGLDAGPNIAYNLSMEEWRDFVDNSVSTLRVLSDETGGFCTCMTNNFKGSFQRIDNEMSDYYMVGYVSSNPDPLRVRRQVEIRITRPELKAAYTKEYLLARPSKTKKK